jgi:hypothetical protein
MPSCMTARVVGRGRKDDPVDTTRSLDFEALKDITRLAWLLNFEALATVPNVADTLTQ